mgnify:CR=1 FL=1|jgi:hypothetical protein
MYRVNLALALLIPFLSSCSSDVENQPPNNPSQKSDIDNQSANMPENVKAFGTSPSGEVVDSGPTPIEPSGTPITDDTKLSVGDIVQVKWEGRLVHPDGKVTNESWWNGEVIDLQEDGTVKIHYSGWRVEWDEAVSRERLRIGSPAAESGDKKG